MARLVSIRGPAKGKAYPLERECILGRGLRSGVYVGDLNVSRRHACIHQLENGTHEIEDLGSGNGTFVNEAQVSRQALEAGDVIRIGGSAFRYEAEEAQRWSEAVLTVIADISLAPHLQKIPSQPLIQLPEQRRRDISEDRALKMLESMYAVADAIASELDLPRLLEKILNHLLDVFPQTERGFVFLLHPDTGQLVPEAIKQRGSDQMAGLQFSQTMINQVMERGEGVIRGATSLLPIKTEVTPPPGPIADGDSFQLVPEEASPPCSARTPQMGMPLICRGESLGTIHLESTPGSALFTPEDLDLLSAIAHQAALAIASARAGKALLVQSRLEEDLRLARQIQRSFLPHKLSQVRGLRFETHYCPAYQVGGDFYDIIALDESRIGILIGDISGKGVSAALLMAKVASDIRLYARGLHSPAEVLTEVNRLFLESEQEGMFSTVLYLQVDTAAQSLNVANAGHQPPLVVSSRFEGVAELDDSTEVALGVLPGINYPEAIYRFAPGDVVVLYTDGINEAKNRFDQEYGLDRLRLALARQSAPPGQLVQQVISDVHRFVGSAPQSDDQTIVAFALAPS